MSLEETKVSTNIKTTPKKKRFINGEGHVYLIDSLVTDNAQCYLIPTETFVNAVCFAFSLKETTLEAAMNQMLDDSATSVLTSENLENLLSKWNDKYSSVYFNISYVKNPDAVIIRSFTDWDQMHG